MISPRTTRLVRVPDLHTFRQAIVELACGGAPLEARDRLVVVPTRAAAAYLLHSLEEQYLATRNAVLLPDLVTPGELVSRLSERLSVHRVRLTEPEREVLAGVACRLAIEDGLDPPFRLRPGLIAEIVGFYDALRRNLKDVATFERLALGALEPGAAVDRGAERLVRQTRFLAAAFKHFERLVERTGRVDEHRLRSDLIAEAAVHPWRHVVLCVADDAVDRDGLTSAHWDLLTRIRGLERIDLVVTDRMLAGSFHQRIHELLPGIEEIRVSADEERPVPVLLIPPGGTNAHTFRDREEEVAGFARWVRHELRNRDAVTSLGRMALVVRRPLPYVYLTREVLRSAGIPVQMFDALPLAAEPFAAALDLVISFVSTNFARTPAVALLRSPHFRFGLEGAALKPTEISALDRALSEAGYLGDLATLERLVTSWRDTHSSQQSSTSGAGEVLLDAAKRLVSLQSPARCADHLDVLGAFLAHAEAPVDEGDALHGRLRRGRAAVMEALHGLRDAYDHFDSHVVEFDETAAILRRWIDAHTFAPRSGDSGVHLVDVAAAPFGSFEAVQLAGLVDGEWPETPRRNIFYSPALLRTLGWPSETDRLESVRAAFDDLLRLPSARLMVSSFALEDDAVVAASTLLDEVSATALATREHADSGARIFEHEALALDPIETSWLTSTARAAADDRRSAVRGHPGRTAPQAMAGYSLSGLERYQDCPFRFFAADVLKLEEPPEDEPMLSPRARGRFVHEVFQRFFEAWEARGGGTITVERTEEARLLFQEVAEPLLARFADAEALLERARLFGSAASVGVVDVVLGLEAARQAPVRERWIEYRFDGVFSLGREGGSTVRIRGVADRVDLLDGNRLRVIDYKSGYAPQPKRALQAPVYALCAQEQLTRRDGQPWHVDEVSYVAFAGKQPLVRVVRPDAGEAAETLASARSRVFEIVAAIEHGDFPVSPYELRMCRYCVYPSVCRKDYVGDD